MHPEGSTGREQTGRSPAGDGTRLVPLHFSYLLVEDVQGLLDVLNVLPSYVGLL